MAKVVTVLKGEVNGGEPPGEVKIETRNELGDGRVGEEGVGVEVCCKTGFAAGSFLGKEEVADADFYLLELLVSVLNRKDVMAVGSSSWMGESLVLEIGL